MLLRDLPDWSLRERYLEGDERAFTELVRRYTPRLTKHLSNMFLGVPDRREVVEDILQETWWRLFIHCRDLNPRFKFSSWLYTVATNLAKNFYRNGKRRHQLLHSWPWKFNTETGEAEPLDIPDNRPLPDKQLEVSNLLDQVIIELETGNSTRREIMEMYLEGF